jgi:hypothetical protein
VNCCGAVKERTEILNCEVFLNVDAAEQIAVKGAFDARNGNEQDT